jgi:thiamine pyrophosphokinase
MAYQINAGAANPVHTAAMQVTIFADGERCSLALNRRLRNGRLVIALDGVAEQARKEGWVPDLVMGDFDTATPKTLKILEQHGSVLLPTPDQNQTDLEKAVQYCSQRYYGFWVAQALGSRLDHSFAALSLLDRYHRPRMDFSLWREGERVRLLKDEKRVLRGKKGRPLALLPFPACRVTSTGLVYEMKNTRLKLGVKASVSNCAAQAAVELNIEGTALLVEAF